MYICSILSPSANLICTCFSIKKVCCFHVYDVINVNKCRLVIHEVFSLSSTVYWPVLLHCYYLQVYCYSFHIESCYVFDSSRFEYRCCGHMYICSILSPSANLICTCFSIKKINPSWRNPMCECVLSHPLHRPNKNYSLELLKTNLRSSKCISSAILEHHEYELKCAFNTLYLKKNVITTCTTTWV